MHNAVRDAGGEGLQLVSLVFGERTRLPHGPPSDHKIKDNEPAVTEIGGMKFGYAAGLVRTGIVGKHSEAEYLHALANEALDAALDVVKPGVLAETVDAAVRKIVERSRRPRAFRNKAGYQTGIFWSERGNMDMVPLVRDTLKVGMTLHLPIMMFSENGHIIGCSDHVLVTDAGAESLSRTPRTLYRA